MVRRTRLKECLIAISMRQASGCVASSLHGRGGMYPHGQQVVRKFCFGRSVERSPGPGSRRTAQRAFRAVDITAGISACVPCHGVRGLAACEHGRLLAWIIRQGTFVQLTGTESARGTPDEHNVLTDEHMGLDRAYYGTRTGRRVSSSVLTPGSAGCRPRSARGYRDEDRAQ